MPKRGALIEYWVVRPSAVENPNEPPPIRPLALSKFKPILCLLLNVICVSLTLCKLSSPNFKLSFLGQLSDANVPQKISLAEAYKLGFRSTIFKKLLPFLRIGMFSFLDLIQPQSTKTVLAKSVGSISTSSYSIIQEDFVLGLNLGECILKLERFLLNVEESWARVSLFYSLSRPKYFFMSRSLSLILSEGSHCKKKDVVAL